MCDCIDIGGKEPTTETQNLKNAMNLEEINFRLTATATNVNVYKANFAGCDIELAEDKESIQLIDENGDYERWEMRDGNWIFTDGSNGQAPTLHWTEDYHNFLETAIAEL